MAEPPPRIRRCHTTLDVARRPVQHLMPTLRLLSPQFLLPAWSVGSLGQLRWLHAPGPRQANDAPKQPSGSQLSLFDELFPEKAVKSSKNDRRPEEGMRHVPRLPLPDLEEVTPSPQPAGIYKVGSQWGESTRKLNAFRKEDMTVLVFRRASKSLDESDFRRMVPKGQHIEEWRGPGDILKVIPGRDPHTLQPLEHYFLLFPNPASARAYQDHAGRTHRMARTHTPTSITSPLPPTRGMVISGEDVHALLQDYALCPPSQTLSLRTLFSPYSHSVKRLLDHGGYDAVVQPQEKTAKAVLLWVEGYQPSTHALKDVIARDGSNRGMSWGVTDGEGSIEKLKIPAASAEESEDSGSVADLELRPRKHAGFSRWVITFDDEAEARRFARCWHRRLYPMPSDRIIFGEPPPLVHAEFLW